MPARRLAFAAAILATAPSIAACKGKSEGKAAEGTGSAKPAPAPDATPAPPVDAAAGVSRPSAPPLPPAPPVKAATDDDCKKTGEYFAPALYAAGEALQVEADQLVELAKKLVTVYVETCKADDWPEGMLDCMGKHPADLFTYKRCFERLPTLKREAWTAKVYETAGLAPPPPPEVVAGMFFEELCPTFVAELARYDDCIGGGVYLPELETVQVERRKVEVGGVVPPDAQAALKAICDQGADFALKASSSMCQQAKPAPSPAPPPAP